MGEVPASASSPAESARGGGPRAAWVLGGGGAGAASLPIGAPLSSLPRRAGRPSPSPARATGLLLPPPSSRRRRAGPPPSLSLRRGADGPRRCDCGTWAQHIHGPRRASLSGARGARGMLGERRAALSAPSPKPIVYRVYIGAAVREEDLGRRWASLIGQADSCFFPVRRSWIRFKI